MGKRLTNGLTGQIIRHPTDSAESSCTNMIRNRSFLLRFSTLFLALSLTIVCFPSFAQLATARGRPHLNAARTTFVADNGQDLRGPYTSTEWTGPAPASQIASMRRLGFNAVHLYAEDFDISYPTNGSTAPGYAASSVDQIVAETRTNGLYLIITIGNGANNGNYNAAYITNFWKFYAPRYANETHVLYEIQNEPVAWGPPYSAANATPPGGLNMEVAAYNVIRQYAPNTPILLFTYAVFGGTGGASSAMTDIRAFNTTVFGNANAVWTNEAVAIHGYAGWQNTSTAVSSLINSGYPCFMTEYAGNPWGSGHGGLDAEMTSELERLSVSWLTFQYVPPTGVSDNVTLPDVYSNVVINSALSWTPDYGGFPPVRAPYGNGSQPWTVSANYTNNVLTGSLTRVEAENFDAGGEGVSYHVTNSANSSVYRPTETVPLETTTDSSGGYDIAGAASGEWFEYTIWIQVAGYYNLSLRYAAENSGCSVDVTGNGHDRTGAWALPSTGSSTTWATVTQPVLLEPGRQKMRISVVTGNLSLNWFQLTPASAGPVTAGTYKFLNAASGLALTGMTGTNAAIATNYQGTAYQEWNLQHVGGNQYKITAVTNGWSWNINNNSLNLTSGWGTGGSQSFILVPSGNGFGHILPVSNGEALETSGTKVNVIDQNPYSGGANQQWIIVPPSAPAVPTGLNVTAGSATQMNVQWNAVAGATSYNIKRSAASGGPYTTFATGVTTTNCTDAVPSGMRFYYVASAVADGYEGLNSFEASCLPYPWQTRDIGSVGVIGSASYSNTNFIVTGSGADIWGTADAFRYVYLPVTGNCTIIAHVDSVQNIDPWSKAGVMIRESLNTNATYSLIAVTPGNGVSFQYRTTTGGSSGNSAIAGPTAPYWVKLVRSGNTFTGYASANGTTWTTVGSQTFTMASAAYVGVEVTAHNNSSVCASVFDGVNVPGWANPIPPAAPGTLAATVTNWNVALAWSASDTATCYNVKRATIDGGPYTVIATTTTTGYNDATAANNTSYYYAVSAVNAAGESANSSEASVAAQSFTPTGLSAVPLSSGQVNLVWNAFTNAVGYNVKRSPVSGGPYTTVVPGVTTTNYTDTVATGMKFYYVVSAMSGGAESPNSAEAAISLPYPWQTRDIGAVGLSGAAGYTNGVFSAAGAGADIQQTADAFRFIYMPATNNCAIIARVASVQNVNAWSKAGIMIRESLNPGAANALVAVTPGNGITWQCRSSTGGSTSYNNTTGYAAPYWLKLVRNGNTFTGYRSADGVNWTTQGSATFSIASNVYIGLALTSHDTVNLVPATFDNVTTSGWTVSAPPAAPAGLRATGVSGSQINLVWNPSAGATSYNVRCSVTIGGPYELIASGVTVTNYFNTGLPPTTTLYYVISALNDSGESTNSAQVSSTTFAPSTFPVLSTSYVGGQLVLQINGAAGPDYEIQASSDMVNWYPVFITNAPAMPFVWPPSVTNGPLNFYRVVVGPPLP
jgi:fibronectin type 3 domain-containing protein/regulation of enolase protein 1 (concanavalin A-like superfamily)